MKIELTERERNVFEYLVGGGEDLAIMRTEFNGETTACIVIMEQKDGGNYNIVPLALLVDENIFSQLKQVSELEEEPSDEVTFLKLNRK